ncbi:MAG: sporulation protein YqfD [Clostridiales bacterium]|nr:sporulation protein YqfD [Clostridiales bacterium]
MKNSCKITFEGLNVSRFVAKLSATSTILSVERQGKRWTIEVPAARANQTLAILREKCYNILNIDYLGATAAAKFVKRRFVLPIICLLCVAMLLISSQFCFRIEVAGDFDKEVVMTALGNAGVKIGSNLSRIDVGVLENTLANDIGAMYAVVTRSGSALYVNVVAKKEIEPPIDMTKRRNIVATREGTVTAVLCEQGNPLVKVGDHVKVGDVLIEGRRVFNDGSSNDVYALGRVTIQLTATGFAEYTGTRTVTVETGEIFTCTGVMLFGKEYSRACPFESYIVETVITRLQPLNLQICRNTYRETRTVTVAATIEECMEELKAKAYEAAKSKCDFSVLDVVYETSAKGVTATLYGEAQIE